MLLYIKSYLLSKQLDIYHKEQKRRKNYGELSQVQKNNEEGLDANRRFCVTEIFVWKHIL